MSDFSVDCTVNISETGKPSCGLDVGRVVGHILCAQGTEFATGAAAKLLANWTTLIQANTAYPLPLSWKQEYTQNEDQEITGSGGKTKILYSLVGKDKFYIPYDILTNDYVANLKSLNNRGAWGVFTITENGYIGGKSSDGTKFQAIDANVRILSRNKASEDDGGDLPYTVQWDSVDDVDLYGQHIKPTDFNPKTDLDGLLDVVLAVVGTPTATELVVTAVTALNGAPVTGLVVGDFLDKTAAGAEQAPSSVTESPDGTYTFVCVGQVTGTISLQIPADMTTTGYKSAGAVSFTVT